MRRYLVIAALFLLIGCALCYLLIPRSGGNWRQVSLSFGGYTNSSAVMSIHNAGPISVVLRSFELEFIGVAPQSPVSGCTNLIIWTPTGTNLVVTPSSRANFLIPIPTNGQRWIAHLEFAPAGVRTKLGEYLIRRQDWWAQSLPPTLRGFPIHVVSQEFSR